MSRSPTFPVFRAWSGFETDGLQMKLVSYWHDTAPVFSGGAHGPVEGHYDAAIIGGGFTGLAAARQLAKAGAKVAVLEAERVGWGASGR
ncbi:FAD-dependent oxidoreductase, partial [Mesorhizobium sp.]|uniref:FAD-dependent oxidoreductase n=1 Tax=Mesorhizobium sp. TaxID=1871066 RepID=UPI0025BD59AB